MLRTGPVASTTTAAETAGVASVKPLFIAATVSVCEPSLKAGAVNEPLSQATGASLSSVHSKVAPAAGELKVQVGVLSAVGLDGCESKTVFGVTSIRTVVSTVPPVRPSLTVYLNESWPAKSSSAS